MFLKPGRNRRNKTVARVTSGAKAAAPDSGVSREAAAWKLGLLKSSDVHMKGFQGRLSIPAV